MSENVRVAVRCVCKLAHGDSTCGTATGLWIQRHGRSGDAYFAAGRAPCVHFERMGRRGACVDAYFRLRARMQDEAVQLPREECVEAAPAGSPMHAPATRLIRASRDYPDMGAKCCIEMDRETNSTSITDPESVRNRCSGGNPWHGTTPRAHAAATPRGNRTNSGSTSRMTRSTPPPRRSAPSRRCGMTSVSTS